MKLLKLTAIALGLNATALLAQDAISSIKTNFSGEIEFDTYTSDTYASGDLKHYYVTTVDLNLDVDITPKWSAHVKLEADGNIDNLPVLYNEAFVTYSRSDRLSVKLGDLAFCEGAFRYYKYDDATYNAAGMKEHDIRGIQVLFNRFELGLGFARGNNDYTDLKGLTAYNAHLAYQLETAGQQLRYFLDYKSYQEARHNEVHAGIDANLALGGFNLHGVYSYHTDYLADNSKLDMTSRIHAFLVEPAFDISVFSLQTAFFYAYILDSDLNTLEGTKFHKGNSTKTFDRRDGDDGEIPEYMFFYAEPSVKLAETIQLGLPIEFHANALDSDADISTLDVGGRLYINPVENLHITGIAMWSFPIGDKNKDDISLSFGLETKFKF